MYVVVNVPEVAPCDNSSSNCVLYYNSNVVFDRNGTIVIMFISITLGFFQSILNVQRTELHLTILTLLSIGRHNQSPSSNCHYIFIESQVNYDTFPYKMAMFHISVFTEFFWTLRLNKFMS